MLKQANSDLLDYWVTATLTKNSEERRSSDGL